MNPSTRRLALSAIALAVLAGCSRHADQPSAAASPSLSRGVTAEARASTPAPTRPGTARKVEVENDTYDFAYAYPAQADALPGLKRVLDADLARARAELISEARDGKAEAADDAREFHAYSSQTGWSVVTDLPGWLSLSAEVYDFSGGAHGNTTFAGALWDKRAKVRRRPEDLFTSPAAFRAAVFRPMCDALNRERAKRRGDDAYPADDEFNKCIDPIGDTTVILGSRGHRGFDRIGFLIAPYSAGPYAEGTYEVTLPVTPAMIAAVRPEYRDAFAVK